MSLITINQLTQASTTSGSELVPVWQNNQTVQTALSTIQSARGTNNFSYDPTGNNNSAVFGGCNNTLSACRSIIFGTASSEIKGSGSNTPIASVIGGGSGNKICCSGFQAAIIAGQNSCIYTSTINAIVASSNSIISGGSNENSKNFIAGGGSNKIIGVPGASNYETGNAIIGGTINRAYGQCGSILGAGCGKTGKDAVTCNSSCYGVFSQVIGGGSIGSFFGAGNEARSNFSTVINGTSNCALAMGSTVIGGCNNNINTHGTGCLLDLQEGGTIIGGNDNIILTGHKNSTIIGGSSMNSVSSNMLHTKTLFLSADMLPTSDPGVRGVVWNDSGVLKISL